MIKIVPGKDLASPEPGGVLCKYTNTNLLSAFKSNQIEASGLIGISQNSDGSRFLFFV